MPWLVILAISASLSALLWAVALRRPERPVVVASLALALVAAAASVGSVVSIPAAGPDPAAAEGTVTLVVAQAGRPPAAQPPPLARDR